MKFFISADIEGITGITNWAETEKDGGAWYEYFSRQMTKEVDAACRAALSENADSVLVKDAHSTARNIFPDQLPQGVRISRGFSGDPLSMMDGIQKNFDACAFIGYHSGAGRSYNPLSHTMSLLCDKITINGIIASEFLINAYTASLYKAPVVFVSGDNGVCQQAREIVPAITTVPVNTGYGSSSVSIHPAEAIELIFGGVKAAVHNIADCRITLPKSFDVQVRYRSHTDAFKKSFYPGAVAIDDQSIRFTSDSYYEVLRFIHFVL